MADQHRPDNLAPIYARLAAQDAEIARLRRRRRLPRRALPLLLAAFLVALVPLATLAAGPFTDLNQGAEHAAANADIQAIADAGITKGCNPPDYTQYCPNDYVLREQMASFLARGLGLGGNAPVANAKTAQTAVSAQTAQTAVSAQTATSAQTAQVAQSVPDGSITAAKLSAAGAAPGQVPVATGGGVAWRTPPPDFGESFDSPPYFFGDCATNVVASMPVTTTAPARLYASGSAVFRRNGTNTAQIDLQVVLRATTAGPVLAQTNRILLDLPSNGEAFYAADGVLRTPPAGPGATTAPYVLAPGSYILELLGSAYCAPGASQPLWATPSLTHLLVGTAP